MIFFFAILTHRSLFDKLYKDPEFKIVDECEYMKEKILYQVIYINTLPEIWNGQKIKKNKTKPTNPYFDFKVFPNCYIKLKMLFIANIWSFRGFSRGAFRLI